MGTKISFLFILILLFSLILMPSSHAETEEKAMPLSAEKTMEENQPAEIPADVSVSGQEADEESEETVTDEDEDLVTDNAEASDSQVLPVDSPPVRQLPARPAKAPATVSVYFDDTDVFEVAQIVFADILKVN